LIAGALIGLTKGSDASVVMRLTLQGAGIAGRLVLLLRFLLLLVSIDPEKPRAITRQNRSASG
jgi:hypothetical protein